MRLVTYELAQIIVEIEGAIPGDITSLADKAPDIDAKMDEIIDEHYVEPLFGVTNRLSFRKWLEMSSNMKHIKNLWYKP